MHAEKLRHSWRDLTHIDFTQVTTFRNALAFHIKRRVKLGMFGKITVRSRARHRDYNIPGEAAAAGATEFPCDNESHSRVSKSSPLESFLARQDPLNPILGVAGGLL